ncbi:PAS domain S-box protein [Falsiroseomonas sp. E2-1-a20]|uniref:PAS domain S-box protein n=1 Tax=Falsiroseomonas sp. E2-1-a20 TaxID=3239300 RepID=UPI003F36753F
MTGVARDGAENLGSAPPVSVTDGESAGVRQNIADAGNRSVHDTLVESAPRANEDRWLSTFEQMHEGFALCELISGTDGKPTDFRFLEVNPAFERLSGIPSAVALGRTVREVIPDIEEMWIETYGRVAESGEPAHVEGPIAALGRWYEAHAYRTGPRRFATQFIDITARHVAEEARRHADAEAHAERRRLQAVLASLPVGVAVIDANGRLLETNAELARIWGGVVATDTIPDYAAWRARWPATGKPLLPSDWAVVRALRKGETTIGEPVDIDRFDGGGIRPTLNSAAPIRDAAGVVMGAVAVLLDVSAEREAESRYRAVVDTAADAIIVSDENGTIESANRAAERIFMRQAGEMVGHNVRILLPEPDRAGHDDCMARYLGTGERHIIGVGREVEGLCGDGTRITLDLSIAEWRGTSQRRRFTAILRDVSDRKARERELRRMAMQQAAILDALPAHVALLDPDGRILAVNESWRRFGARNGLKCTEACVGRNYIAACDAAAAAGEPEGAVVAAALRELLAGRQGRFERDYGYTCEPSSGGERWFRLVAVPAALSGDGAGGAVVMHLDITEARRNEEALRHAERMEAIGELTSGLSHDFANVLQAMMSGLRMLERGASDRLQQRIAAETAEAGSRARGLVHQLLALARGESPEPERIVPAEVVLGMEELLRASVGHAIELLLDVPHVRWSIMVEAGGLETALLNLSINALDAMPAGGRLVINMRNVSLDEGDALRPGLAPGDYVSITVCDTGTGMPPEVRTRVFDAFFTTKPRGAGTGLGLAMVSRLMRRSGGHVRLDSTPGKGTEFELLFPRAV